MKKQIIIHCGFHKTASSSVQYSLAENRKKLEKLGYYYPDFAVNNHRFYNQSIPLFGLFSEHLSKYANSLERYTNYNEFDSVYIDQLINDALENDVAKHDRVIISDEFISGLSFEELTKLKNRFEQMGFKVRVITFVRDPFNLVTSQIQQRISKNHILGLLNKFSEREKSYLKIETLIDAFGADVEFHCFEKACQFSGGPVAYLLNLLGIEELGSIILRTINESRSNQAVRLISYINEDSLEHSQDRKDIFPLLSIKGEKFVLSSQEFSQIEATVSEERKKISALLGSDFFMPINYATCDAAVVWNKEQIDMVISILPKLKKSIALITYRYFYQLHLQDNLITYEQLNKMAYRVIKIFPNAIQDIKFPATVTPKKTSKYKKVILHVGSDKTGSTTIQLSLDKYRELLLEHGVFYPLGAGNEMTRHYRLGSCVTPEVDLFSHYNKELNREQHLQEVLKRDRDYETFLIECFNKTQADILVLSCEGFAHLTKTAFERMKTFLEKYCDDIEVVFYVRAPLSYAVSGLSERLKGGHGFDPYYFPAFPFKDVLDKLIAVFGKDKISVRKFAKKPLPKGNVLLDFLSLLNLPKSVQEQIVSTMPDQNPSLSAEARLIGNRMIELFDGYIPVGEAFRRGSGLGKKFLPRIKGNKFQLSNLQKKGVLKLSKPHVDYLANEFGITLDDEKSMSYSPPEISVETIDFAARTLINVLVPDFDLSTGKKRLMPLVSDVKIDKREIRNTNIATTKSKSSKFKKIILHIGPDKTGSTSIQSVMDSSRELLLEHGVLYGPGHKQKNLRSCFATSSDFFVYNRIDRHDKDAQYIFQRDEEYLLSLRKAFTKCEAEILVLSCEGFVYLSETAFSRMKEFLEEFCDSIEVVLYVRAPLSYAASAISERIKTGERAWEGRNIPILPYRDFLEKLRLVFGDKQINLRLFAKDLLPNGNVVLDFLSLFDLPDVAIEQILSTMSSQNSSLSEEAVLIGDRMIALLDGYIPFGAEFKKKRGIGGKALPMIKGRKIQLTTMQQRSVLSLAKPHMDYLAKEFGVTLKNEPSYSYKPLGISPDTVDFTAKILLNVLVPDFNITDKELYARKGLKGKIKAATRLYFKQKAEVFKYYLFAYAYPQFRARIKSILIKMGMYK